MAANDPWLDVDAITKDLSAFFQQRHERLTHFGSRVNQVFEAFVFAQTIAWHRERGWAVEFRHPSKPSGKKARARQTEPLGVPALNLKFNTRGRPSGYSFAVCSKDGVSIQVRHGLRVMTRYGEQHQISKANMVLDVSVIQDVDLEDYTTDTPLPNRHLITFGEAKHMSAFAELVASFLGMVSELQPDRLRVRAHSKQRKSGLLPFLYVSGYLTGTASGMRDTIRRRGFAIDIYSRTEQLTNTVKLHERPRPIHARASETSTDSVFR